MDVNMTTYMKITLICFLLLRTARGQNMQEDSEGLVSNEDSQFLVVKLAEGIFTSSEDTVSYIAGNIRNLVDHLDSSLKFAVYSVSTLIDILIRQPANIVNIILYALSWTISSIVYVILDIFLHSIVKEGILLVIWILISFLHLMINILIGSLLAIIQLFKTLSLVYLEVITFIFVYIIVPCLDSLFWTISFLTIIMGGLLLIFAIKNGQHFMQNSFHINSMGSVLIFIPIVYAVYDIWITLCSAVLKFICYPVIIFLYSLGICYLTFQFFKLLFENCEHALQVFNQEQFTALAQQGRTVILRLQSRLFVTEPAHDMKNYAAESSSTHTEFYNERECIICFNEQQFVTLFPCGHKVMCFECTTRVLENDTRCPICRSTIRYYLTNDVGTEV